MRQENYTDICLVGMGGHARNRLIPALSEAGKVMKAVVSRSQGPEIGIPVYASIHEALTRLSDNVVFILASPPALHYEQALATVRAGFNVFIEKPALIHSWQVESIRNVSLGNGVFVVEMFMYFESDLCERVIRFITQGRERISRIEMQFLIPGLPQDTFRDGKSFASSLLLDIGCYPISMLVRAGLLIEDLSLSITGRQGGQPSCFLVSGRADSISVEFRVGLGVEYRNDVRVVLDDGAQWVAEPFFFGRPGQRSFKRFHRSPGNELSALEAEYFTEDNAFVRMFKRSSCEWINSQAPRFEEMRVVSAVMEDLFKLIHEE